MRKEGGKGKALARSALFFIIYSLYFSPAGAQTSVTSTYQIGGGTVNILDTYLSQEKFKGGGATLLLTSERQREGRNWLTAIEHEVNFNSAEDRAKTVSELQGDYTLLMGRYRRWQFGKIELKAGVLGALNAGFIYNTSNSNNPAQARLSLNVMPSAVVSKPFTLFRQQFAVRYELDLPLAGVMFSPNYGQSYYEIFNRGNYDHNIVPTTFISAPNMRQQLSIDWQAGRSWDLRVGYLGNYQQAEVNHLKQHIYNHRLMIGVVKRFRTVYYKR